MPAAAVATLALTAVLVLGLAGHLLWVGWSLRHVTRTLDGVVAGLDRIAHTAQPLGGLLGEINEDLGHVEASVNLLATKLPDDTPSHTSA